MNLQESIRRILREETELPLFIRRRFNHKDLDQLINDVEDAILRYGNDKHIDDAIYDEVRGFITEFVDYEDWHNMNDNKYWDTWLKYETPLVNYVKHILNNKKHNEKEMSEEKELDEYARTLKNARQQGVGLRFPKSAIKSNPSRFRPYNR